ncbi:MAG TPA: hypothetical protein VKT82_05655 [Ktedonobacterales bacterium]|nr:hypothetical protein [Ktedonobacterales bacterium]
MMPDETPFSPAEIDEQIDRLAQPRRSPQRDTASSPEQQLVDDLGRLYSAEAAALPRAVARGRERLAESSPAQRVPQPHTRASDYAHEPEERQNTMRPFLKRFSQEPQRFYRLGSLVAVALLVVLVGSLVAGLVLVRLGSQTTIVSQPQTSLKGGLEIVFQASCDVPSKHCTPNQLRLLSTDSAALKGRIENGLGISQVVIQQQSSDQIVVDLPPQVRTQDALTLLMPTGKLEILDTGTTALQVGSMVTPGQYPVRFTGDQLDPTSVHALLEPQSGQPVIVFQFKSQEQAAFATYTQQNIGNYLTMTLDGKVIESAVIQSQITGQAEISGGQYYTLADAQETAALIRYSVPLPLTIVSKQTITT